MRLSDKQIAIMRNAVIEKAPLAKVRFSKSESGTGHIAVTAVGLVTGFYIANRGGSFGTMELTESGDIVRGDNGKPKAFMSTYNAIKTALHEYGHVIQAKQGMMDKYSYAMLEIVTEYVAMKLTGQYFPESHDQDQEQGSRYYIATYYHGHSPVVLPSQKMTNTERENFKTISSDLVKSIYPEVKRIAEKMANH